MSTETKAARTLLVAGVMLVLAFAGALSYRFLIAPRMKGELVEATSSESRYKIEVKVAADAFSGYAFLRSSVMIDDLARQGIRLKVIDDKADYASRMKALKDGSVDCAMFPINSFIKTGLELGEFPASVVLVVDQTIGADAMVAYKQGLGSLNDLNYASAGIMAPKDSPSEFLGQVSVASLSLPNLPKNWLIVADSGADVYEKFKKANKTDRRAFVMWEPYVSQALKDPDAHVLLSSKDTSGYIVDVFVVRRDFISKQPKVVSAILRSYSSAAYHYVMSDRGLINLVIEDAKKFGDKLSQIDAENVIKGIKWANTMENFVHFDLAPDPTGGGLDLLEDMIRKIADVLVKTGAVPADRVAAMVTGHEHTMFYKQFLHDMQMEDYHPAKKINIIAGAGPGRKDLEAARGRVVLPPLNESQWDTLSSVGAMRMESIDFRRGTAEIGQWSTGELEALARRINALPAFYVKIRGSAQAVGDPEENRKLAEARAIAVRDFLVMRGVNPSRLQAKVVQAANDAGSKSEVSFELGQVAF